MKWPIESMFVAIKPVANTTDVAFPNNKALQTWHKFSSVTDSVVDVDGVSSCKIDATADTEIAAFLAVADPAGAGDVDVLMAAYDALAKTSAAAAALFALAAGSAANGLAQGLAAAANADAVYAVVQSAAAAAYGTHPVVSGACAQADLTTVAPTVDRLSVTAHGIDIYKEMPGTFFHSYTPYTFGGHNVCTPEDPGAHMITFCLYPGSYQPSGHMNISRAREFYLQYWAANSLVSSGSPADLVIVASAINFLLISDGSAVLRYST